MNSHSVYIETGTLPIPQLGLFRRDSGKMPSRRSVMESAFIVSVGFFFYLISYAFYFGLFLVILFIFIFSPPC